MSQEAIWLVICGLCFIGEISTVSFLLFLPGLAAFIAFILALFNFSLTTQIIVFVIVTTLSVIFIRPLMKRMFKTKDFVTNSNTLIGKTGTVIKEIDKDIKPGQVKVAGEIWSAITEENICIPKDSLVTIQGINGVKLLVKKLEEE
jgi:membrane protein implicated in regulation of membrane protease activity